MRALTSSFCQSNPLCFETTRPIRIGGFSMNYVMKDQQRQYHLKQLSDRIERQSKNQIRFIGYHVCIDDYCLILLWDQHLIKLPGFVFKTWHKHANFKSSLLQFFDINTDYAIFSSHVFSHRFRLPPLNASFPPSHGKKVKKKHKKN